jgi:uncharacterized protein (DUF1330 family)
MQPVFGMGMGILIGTVIGAAAVTGLHAQGNSPVYVVSEIDVTNPEAFAKEYAPKVQDSIKAAGGKVLALGGTQGAGAKRLVVLEGDPPKRVAIQRWDSMDAVKKWWDSAETKATHEIGLKYAKFRRFVVDEVDLTR